MRVIVISEKRLDELFEQFLAKTFKNVDTQQYEATVRAGSVQYNACHLKDEVKNSGLGV